MQGIASLLDMIAACACVCWLVSDARVLLQCEQQSSDALHGATLQASQALSRILKLHHSSNARCCIAQPLSAAQGSVTPTQSPLKPAGSNAAQPSSSFGMADLTDIMHFLLHTARQAACAWGTLEPDTGPGLSNADVALHHDALVCLRDLLDQHPKLQSGLLDSRGAGKPSPTT